MPQTFTYNAHLTALFGVAQGFDGGNLSRLNQP